MAVVILGFDQPSSQHLPCRLPMAYGLEIASVPALAAICPSITNSQVEFVNESAGITSPNVWSTTLISPALILTSKRQDRCRVAAGQTPTIEKGTNRLEIITYVFMLALRRGILSPIVERPV
jgi:hypothetical protein